MTHFHTIISRSQVHKEENEISLQDMKLKSGSTSLLIQTRMFFNCDFIEDGTFASHTCVCHVSCRKHHFSCQCVIHMSVCHFCIIMPSVCQYVTFHVKVSSVCCYVAFHATMLSLCYLYISMSFFLPKCHLYFSMLSVWHCHFYVDCMKLHNFSELNFTFPIKTYYSNTDSFFFFIRDTLPRQWQTQPTHYTAQTMAGPIATSWSDAEAHVQTWSWSQTSLPDGEVPGHSTAERNLQILWRTSVLYWRESSIGEIEMKQLH